MAVWFWFRRKPYRRHTPFKPRRHHGKCNWLSIALIVIGILLIMFYTPAWVWCFLLGLVLVAAGFLSLQNRR
ncbi:MAG: hypothetical protein ACOX27_09195 [Caldicoprobacterales bacterium]|nr:cytochrome d ubiquinol oxidase subunit II [Clostridiales bacterium]